MTFECPNCHKGLMVSRGKRYRKCNKCGYIKYKSPHGSQQGTVLFPPKEKDEIPKITTKEGRREEKKDKHHAIPKGEGYHTQDYKDQKFIHDQQIKITRKRQGIDEILKKLRKNKYNPIKTIEIDGEVWDVEKGKTLAEIAEEEKRKKEPKEELTPDRALEELVKAETG